MSFNENDRVEYTCPSTPSINKGDIGYCAEDERANATVAVDFGGTLRIVATECLKDAPDMQPGEPPLTDQA